MTAPRRSGVVDSWSVFVEDAAEFAEQLLDEVEQKLDAASMPGASVAVQLGLLTVRLNRLPDYRQLIRVEPYGAHLECEHVTLLTPGLLKRCLAGLLSGDGFSWSRARPPELERELRAVTTVVRHALAESCKELVASMAVGPMGRRRDLDDVLESW